MTPGTLPAGKLRGCFHAQASVGTHQFPGEAPAQELVVEALDLAVLPGTARFDAERLDLLLSEPVAQAAAMLFPIEGLHEGRVPEGPFYGLSPIFRLACKRQSLASDESVLAAICKPHSSQ